MHVEAFSESSKGHMGTFGQRVEYGELQAGNAVALFQFEMEGGDGGIEPHPGDQGGKGLLLHFAFETEMNRVSYDGIGFRSQGAMPA